ncbi:MAG TPA: hypothetical protein VI258_10130, partial [Rhodanobacteraceae bacterium]
LTLFATHYFELTALPSENDGCANVHFDAVETKSWQGPGIVFLHHVEDGPANRSYGLQVARLAGVPADTLRQAQRYFTRLDKFNVRDDVQHDLFAQEIAVEGAYRASSQPTTVSGNTPPAPPSATATSADSTARATIVAKLSELDPDALSPRDALAALYDLKRLLGASTSE